MNKLLIDILSKSNTWDDIYSQIKNINNDNKKLAGTLFEYLCKLYYEILYADEFKNVWLFPEIPLSVKNKINISSTKTEYGTDLLIKTNDNKYIAVQCKFRSDQKSTLNWSKDKLANLFAEGDKCDEFIVFTNAAGIDAYSTKKHKEKLTIVTYGDLIQELTKETIAKIRNILKGKPLPKPKKYKPYAHQRKAINAVVSGFNENKRGKLILPCGAGKTLTSLWIKEEIKPKRTLILVPSLALVRQFKKDWKEQQKEYNDYLCVCSEKDIDRGGDSNTSHIYELQAPGKVTTDPEIIRDFLKKKGDLIVYATYQSSPKVAAAVKGTNIKLDLAICDEAHKTAGVRESTFATILDENTIPVKKRLFMTATPRIVSDIVKNKLGDETYKYLADMNNEKVYGIEFYRMSFAEAIEKDILVDYKILAVGITDRELQGFIKKRKFASDTTIDEIANNYALEKIMKQYNCSHAVTFHSNVKKAIDFKERHLELFRNKSIFHVNGKQTTNQRADLLNEFKTSGKAVITNARCLTEGIDVPAIDAVYFCDPKYSKIDIVQAAGRALRKNKNKDKPFGHIIVPIFHGEGEDVDKALENNSFAQLVSIVRALADQDERIEDEIKNVIYGEGERTVHKERIVIDTESAKLIELKGFNKKLRDSIFFQVIRKSVIAWRPFEQAREFVQGIGLSSKAEWEKYCKGLMHKKGLKPDDIPYHPRIIYKNKGWISLGDWLGTGRIATFEKVYRSFKEARAFVHSLKLKNGEEWKNYCKGEMHEKVAKPENIPATPDRIYKSKGWISLGDWLGTGTVTNRDRIYRSFIKAKVLVYKLKLKSQKEWQVYCKSGFKPDDIPSNPRVIYKDKGWNGYGDWLGTGIIAPQNKIYLTFQKAREFVHKLNLKSSEEWQVYCKLGGKPDDIPASPHRIYKKGGWIGYGDWLGTGNIALQNQIFLTFKTAREFVHGLQLKNSAEWKHYCKGKLVKTGIKPDNIPTNPNITYKNKGWNGYGDWLGTRIIANRDRIYRSFTEARKFVRNLNLKNRSEWMQYCNSEITKIENMPIDIPRSPWHIYKDKGWISLGDWLGTGRIATQNKKYRSFEEVKVFVQKLKLNSISEWKKYCKGELSKLSKIPDDIPSNPNQTYKNKGWISWPDWLGTNKN